MWQIRHKPYSSGDSSSPSSDLEQCLTAAGFSNRRKRVKVFRGFLHSRNSSELPGDVPVPAGADHSFRPAGK